MGRGEHLYQEKGDNFMMRKRGSKTCSLKDNAFMCEKAKKNLPPTSCITSKESITNYLPNKERQKEKKKEKEMTARQKPSLPNLGAHEEFTAAFKEEKKAASCLNQQ